MTLYMQSAEQQRYRLGAIFILWLHRFTFMPRLSTFRRHVRFDSMIRWRLRDEMFPISFRLVRHADHDYRNSRYPIAGPKGGTYTYPQFPTQILKAIK